MAGRQGFEPRYRGPEPRVLPLDDLPIWYRAACRAEALSVLLERRRGLAPPKRANDRTRRRVEISIIHARLRRRGCCSTCYGNKRFVFAPNRYQTFQPGA